MLDAGLAAMSSSEAPEVDLANAYAAMLAEAPALPAIGTPVHGGLFAGISTNADGQPYALVLLQDRPERELTWQAAMDWAKALDADLPSRTEAALLFQLMKVKGGLSDDWHWTNQTASWNASYAWTCNFTNGYQYGLHKSAEGSCVAVRRFLLQSFNPLIEPHQPAEKAEA
jgi:hypothetical protein